MIGSTASADKNSLDTGTLGWSGLDNQADFKVEHSGVGLSMSPSLNTNILTSAAMTLPSALMSLGSSGSASSTTYAAISDGSVVIRDQAQQQQDVATLSRDVEHANNTLSPIFNKEKEQQRLRQAQLIGEIGGQVMDIVRTQGELDAEKEAVKSGQSKVARPSDSDSDQLWADYKQALTETQSYKDVMKTYGTGSSLQQAAQAATAAVQALAGGDIQQAIASGAAPYLAQLVKDATLPKVGTPTASQTAANLMGHAIVGAVVAQLSGKDAAAGAVGAVGGEFAAKYIRETLFDGRAVSDLTESEKQSLSALSTLAAGLASGLVSETTSGAASGAAAGKNAVENNALAIPVPPPPVAGTNTGDAVTEANQTLASALDKKLNELGEAIDKATDCSFGRACSSDDSGQTDGPNVAGNLTDAEKTELGGTETGAPMPPENDPNQNNEEPVQNLNQKQESAIKKIDNTIKNALKDHDITGTLKDMDGNPVPKENSGYWDHMQEMQNTLRGLRNHADTLKNVNNPEAQAAYGRATDAINKIESALKGNGI